VQHQIDNSQLEQVNSFVYLSWITSQDGENEDITRRTSIARSSNKMNTTVASEDIFLGT